MMKEKNASGGQGALSEETAPWNPAKTFDLLFLHAPAGFNKHRDPLSGVFPAAVGSNDFFLHAPIGIKSLVHRLKARGFAPGFVNVGRLYHEAVQKGEKFDLDGLLRGVSARGFGIDLHWAVHTPGALDLAAAVKKIHPDAFVFLGGLTASYFYLELLNDYRFIDAVVLGEGDLAVEPLARALEQAGPGKRPRLTGIPNLAYRNGGEGDITVSEIRVPDNWEDTRFHDIPDIEEYGTCTYISIKGCTMDCPFCGGSSTSYRRFFHRDCLIALPPAEVVRQMEICQEKGAEMVYLLGDIRIMGKEYVDTFMAALNDKKLDLRIQQELFFPADTGYLERWKKAARDCSLIFSPESADFKVRKRMGKHFTDDAMWEMAKTCSHLELPLVFSFLFALPEQDVASVRRTMDFVEEAVTYRHIDFVNEPMLYIDPASPIFEEPGKWGYHIDIRTIKDFKEYLERPYWRQSTGYYTDWMSKDELADMVLEVAERSARIRMKEKPLKSPLYLLTVENRGLNREMLDFLKKPEPPGDEETRKMIKDLFPGYLLKDNLAGKDRVPVEADVPYSGFSYLIYLLVEILEVPPRALAKALKEWFAAHPMRVDVTVEEFREVNEAPGEFKDDILSLIKDRDVDPQIKKLLLSVSDYEWLNRLAVRVSFEKPYSPPHSDVKPGNLASSKLELNETAVFKTFPYDFASIDWKFFHKGENPPEQSSVDYLYFLQGKSRRAIAPALKQLLLQCNGQKPLIDIIFRLKNTAPLDPLSTAVELGAMVSAGILKIATKTQSHEEEKQQNS